MDYGRSYARGPPLSNLPYGDFGMEEGIAPDTAAPIVEEHKEEMQNAAL